jgi:2-C-methyl-D-erythritol 4-phosphate cytidylyltransferase
VAVEASDTIIQIDENKIIKSVPERKTLRCCQTPQCFNTKVIKEAHLLAKKNNFNTATDDCSLILKFELCPVYVVNGDINNIKITFKKDVNIAEQILLKN